MLKRYNSPVLRKRHVNYKFRIPLEGDEILQVHGERTQGVVKTLMNTKIGLLKDDELKFHLKLVLEIPRKEKLYAKLTKISDALSRKGMSETKESRAMSIDYQSVLRTRLLATPSERPRRNTNVLNLGLVRADGYVIQYGAQDGMILGSPSEALKLENVLAKGFMVR
ncbi:hypothetical protein Tco_1203115 [Tanacetum coccineum]